MLRKTGGLIVLIMLLLSRLNLLAEPPATKTSDLSTARARLTESANGWMYVKGEWVHPAGYKFLRGKVLRTTAKTGGRLPKAPGRLAQENAAKLTPQASSGASAAAKDRKITSDQAAEIRRKNLAPPPASQTGSHL